jgi:chromosome partitioning protein
VYAEDVLGESPPASNEVEDDPHCLAQLKHYRSLMPMALEARKPVFDLRPADGAFGGHQQAVRRAYEDFKALTLQVESRTSSYVQMSE